MNAKDAWKGYHDWLETWVDLDKEALKMKRKKAEESDFTFLRATFFRWIQRWHNSRAAYTQAPALLSVGDIHLENFGIWRDRDGRLAWGVNDFDDACVLPYTQDILRLAVSVQFAITQEKAALHLSLEDSHEEILEGYSKTIEDGPKNAHPVVLAERNAWLRKIADEQIDSLAFWSDQQEEDEKTIRLPWDSVPEEVRIVLLSLWPETVLGQANLPDFRTLKWYRRRAGLGSLGRPRFAVLGDWRGGIIAREAKALAPSSYFWATKKTPITYPISYMLTRAIRSPDPILKVADQWVVRRIAPDCIKLETKKLPESNQKQMLRAMGREIANVHLGLASEETITAINADLTQRKKKDGQWFAEAVSQLARQVQEDRNDILK